MDNWEKFNKTSSPEKEDFYTRLNMEDIRSYIRQYIIVTRCI